MTDSKITPQQHRIEKTITTATVIIVVVENVVAIEIVTGIEIATALETETGIVYEITNVTVTVTENVNALVTETVAIVIEIVT